MTKKIPVILDGDPGHDDAIAWVLANASPMLDIKAVTSVCGNQTIEKTTYNAGRIMTLIGLDVPLAMLTPAKVRTWRTAQLDTGKKTQTSRAYGLLNAIMQTAAADLKGITNPCIVKGGQSTSTRCPAALTFFPDGRTIKPKTEPLGGRYHVETDPCLSAAP